MARLRQVTRKVPVKTLKPLQSRAGGPRIGSKSVPSHRRVLDPLKSRKVARPAQGNNSLTST